MVVNGWEDPVLNKNIVWLELDSSEQKVSSRYSVTRITSSHEGSLVYFVPNGTPKGSELDRSIGGRIYRLRTLELRDKAGHKAKLRVYEYLSQSDSGGLGFYRTGVPYMTESILSDHSNLFSLETKQKSQIASASSSFYPGSVALEDGQNGGPVFRAEKEEALIGFTLKDGKGLPVLDLPKEAFQLNIGPQNVAFENFSNSVDPINLIFVLDNTGSMASQLDKLLTSIDQLEDAFHSIRKVIGRVAIVLMTAARVPRFTFESNEGIAGLKGYLAKAGVSLSPKPGGQTSFYDSISVALQLGVLAGIVDSSDWKRLAQDPPHLLSLANRLDEPRGTRSAVVVFSDAVEWSESNYLGFPSPGAQRMTAQWARSGLPVFSVVFPVEQQQTRRSRRLSPLQRLATKLERRGEGDVNGCKSKLDIQAEAVSEISKNVRLFGGKVYRSEEDSISSSILNEIALLAAQYQVSVDTKKIIPTDTGNTNITLSEGYIRSCNGCQVTLTQDPFRKVTPEEGHKSVKQEKGKSRD